MPEPALSMTRVTRVHGHDATQVYALDDVSLAVFPGELVAVMGSSGSGKSTLLNLAGGLDRPTSGAITVHGQRIDTMKPAELAAVRRDQVGFIFQYYNLIPSLTAQENVALPLELAGTGGRQARLHAGEMMRLVGMGEHAHRYPDELSGGQQQRLAIARALVGQRKLILADEPTAALDTHIGQEILELIRERCDNGSAALLVTHEPRNAAWADRVIFLRDGKITDSSATSQDLEALLSTIRSATPDQSQPQS
jgi:putative ABC transport system ATP-binding protein